jgi:hypothetical protein
MPIKFKIEKQFLYLVMKALRAKNDKVLHAIIKKLNDFLLFFILFYLKVKSTKFIYFASFLIQINNYGLKKSLKKKHVYRKNHSKSLNEDNRSRTKFR